MRRLKTGLLAFAAAVSMVLTVGVSPVAQAGEWPTDKECKKVAKDADSIIKGGALRLTAAGVIAWPVIRLW